MGPGLTQVWLPGPFPLPLAAAPPQHTHRRPGPLPTLVADYGAHSGTCPQKWCDAAVASMLKLPLGLEEITGL